MRQMITGVVYVTHYCQKSEVWEARNSCVYVPNTFYLQSAYVPVGVWFG